MKNKIAVVVLLLGAACTGLANEDFASADEVLFSSSWLDGVDRSITIQAPVRGSINVEKTTFPEMPRALKIEISRGQSYRGVANGTPRAELAFDAISRFIRKREYFVKWQILIPSDYQFDGKQSEVISQIHQGSASGYPTFALFFSTGRQYGVRSRTGNAEQSVGRLFGSPAEDRGRVVDWTLHYIPDDTGRRALTELYKDDRLVFKSIGIPNAYPGDDNAYFKIGIYKADWKNKPSDADVSILYFGRVVISMRSPGAS